MDTARKVVDTIRRNLNVTSAQWETMKEGARIAVFAVAASILTSLGEVVGAFDQTELWVIGATFLLRMADKWVHETEATERIGILPF